MRRFAAAIAAAVILVAGVVSADTIIVDCRGSGDYFTIQEGIDAAVDGDVVLVLPGTYTGSSNRDLNFHGSDISVESRNGARRTVIDCEGLGRAFYFHSGETANARIKDFTIRNGVADNGGAIYCNNASPTLEGLKLTDNSATANGGAIYCETSALHITDSMMRVNSAVREGGGVWCGGFSEPTVNEVVFEQNTAEAGGGMYWQCTVDHYAGTLTSVEFLDNTAASGGGLFMFVKSQDATLNNVDFIDNQATGGLQANGGGMLCCSSSPHLVNGCTFSGNSAENNGGGMYCHGLDNSISNPTLEGATFTANSATSGGGMYCGPGAVPVIWTATISGNEASANGGGFCLGEGGAYAVLDDVIFNGNQADRGGGMHCDPGAGGFHLTNTGFVGNIAESAGGGLSCDAGMSMLESVTFTANEVGTLYPGGSSDGGGMYCGAASPTLANVVFEGNSCDPSDFLSRGGGLYCGAGATASLTNVTFSDNEAKAGGGVNCFGSAANPATLDPFEYVGFFGNAAQQGGGMLCVNNVDVAPIHITFADNSATQGAGLYLIWGAQLDIENTIITSSPQGEAIACLGPSSATLTCCDVDGNAGGDWVGCLAGQNGANGNIEVDPQFCGAANPDEPFTLLDTSPCAEENNPTCGQIGAYGIGCTAKRCADLWSGESPSVDRLVLLAPTPNPFAGAAAIQYIAPEDAGNLTVAIYSASGRLVRELLKEPATPGRHVLTWDGKDDRGHRVAAGAYFCRASLGHDEASAKLILIH